MFSCVLGGPVPRRRLVDRLGSFVSSFVCGFVHAVDRPSDQALITYDRIALRQTGQYAHFFFHVAIAATDRILYVSAQIATRWTDGEKRKKKQNR